MFKKTATTLLLLSFLTVVFFNFSAMSRASDGSMQGDCPFSPMGASLCPQNTLPGVIHHISESQSFLNVPVSSGLATLINALLVVISIALIFSFHPFLYRSPVFVPYAAPPFTSHERKIKRWLSLFEHSPFRS
ncbi:MAG: hypothetical protein Q7R59_02390 [bacterium]|nr:hypothetical protein [bacterium]